MCLELDAGTDAATAARDKFRFSTNSWALAESLVFENSYNHRLFSTYTQKKNKTKKKPTHKKNNKQHGESKFEAAVLKVLSIHVLRARQHSGIRNSK